MSQAILSGVSGENPASEQSFGPAKLLFRDLSVSDT
jgi:hypothetical protein